MQMALTHATAYAARGMTSGRCSAGARTLAAAPSTMKLRSHSATRHRFAFWYMLLMLPAGAQRPAERGPCGTAVTSFAPRSASSLSACSRPWRVSSGSEAAGRDSSSALCGSRSISGACHAKAGSTGPQLSLCCWRGSAKGAFGEGGSMARAEAWRRQMQSAGVSLFDALDRRIDPPSLLETSSLEVLLELLDDIGRSVCPRQLL